MTDTLTFQYVVMEGDETDAFDILDTRTNKHQRFSTAFIRPAAAEVCIDFPNTEQKKITSRLAVETINQYNGREQEYICAIGDTRP